MRYRHQTIFFVRNSCKINESCAPAYCLHWHQRQYKAEKSKEEQDRRSFSERRSFIEAAVFGDKTWLKSVFFYTDLGIAVKGRHSGGREETKSFVFFCIVAKFSDNSFSHFHGNKKNLHENKIMLTSSVLDKKGKYCYKQHVEKGHF
jgi:hypothetical protein